MPPTAVATDVAPGTYEYDPVHSSVTFTVRHFGAGKFRGAIDHDQGCVHHTVSASILSYSAWAPKKRIAKTPA